MAAVCDCFPRSTLNASPDAIFTGSPPLAFTFGLGGLLLFPLSLAVAVARYRLLDAEVLVNRTIVYGTVTALLAGAYVGPGHVPR